MIKGVDISSYQPSYIPTKGVDFVIVKATEGTGYRNPHRAAQLTRARSAGCVVGHYHWLHHGNIADQVRYFLASSDIRAGDLLVCDWEQEGCTNADKDQFIKAVQKARPACRVLLYCNAYWWTSKDTSGFCGDGLWIAAYGVKDPGIKTAWVFWQYEGTTLDLNHGQFASRAALRAWANKKQGTTTVPTKKPTGVSAKPTKPAAPAKPDPRAGLYQVTAKSLVIRTRAAMGSAAALKRAGKIVRRPKGYRLRILSTKRVAGVLFGRSTNYWYVLTGTTKKVK